MIRRAVVWGASLVLAFACGVAAAAPAAADETGDDKAGPVVVDVEHADPPEGTDRSAVAGAHPLACWVATAHVEHTSHLGSTIYVYWHQAYWCEDGVNVTTIYNRSDWFTEKQSVVYVGDAVTNVVSQVPYPWAFTHMQRRVDLCVATQGCYASLAPWLKLTFYTTPDGAAANWKVEGDPTG